MTDTTTQPAPKKPGIAYHYRDGNAFKTPIGPVWIHKNGKGFNIELPLNGHIVGFFESEKPE